MEFHWLRCKVLPGMFSNERLVLIVRSDGSEITSFLVDKNLIEALEPTPDHPIDGRLRVQASTTDHFANVMLPVSTVEHGRIVSVPAELLAR